MKPPRPAEPRLFDAGADGHREEHFADEFAIETEPAHPEPVERMELAEATPAAEPWEPAPEAPMYDVHDSSRPAFLPTAIGIVLGLLVGFAGGYFVGSRDRLAPEAQTATAAASGSPTGATTPAPAGAATHDQPGQYSEQKVSPAPAAPPAATESKPVEPKAGEVPPVVQETEASRGAAAREPASAAPRKTPPAPAPTSERARSNGTIVVKSSPSRAGVTVNGKWRGRTPLTLDRLPFGRYSVRIVQPGYRVAQEEFTLGSRDADHTFSAKLERTTPSARRESAAPAPTVREAPAGGFVGTLYVDSRPRGATVWLDGKSIGVTPLSLAEVPIGSHVVRVELAGKKPWTSSTTVTSGQMTRVTMSLEDK